MRGLETDETAESCRNSSVVLPRVALKAISTIGDIQISEVLSCSCGSLAQRAFFLAAACTVPFPSEEAAAEGATPMAAAGGLNEAHLGRHLDPPSPLQETGIDGGRCVDEGEASVVVVLVLHGWCGGW